MRDRPKMVTGWGQLALALAMTFFCLAAVTAFGDSAASATVVSTFYRPATLEQKDQFYRDYLSGADEAIRVTYLDRWRYHEIQSSFYQRRSTDIHLDIATFTNPSIGPSEADVRSEFARGAFRMRLDATIRKFMTDDRAKNVRRAQQFVESFRAQSVKLSSPNDSSPPAELRMGYDMLSDVARLEYLKGTAGMGLYHQRFLGTIFTSRRTDDLTFNSWKSFNNGLPSASLGYAFGTRAMQVGLSKYLNPVVRADVVAVKPMADNGVPHSVGTSVTYTF